MTTEPIKTTLLRISGESAAMAAAFTAFEHALSGLIESAPGPDIPNLQKIDEIRQSIEGLSQFLDHFAQAVDPQLSWIPKQVAKSLPMQAQGNRLSGQISEWLPDKRTDPEVW